MRPFKQLKPKMLEKTFYIQNVCEDLKFAMMIVNVENSFGGESRRAKTTDFGDILRFKPLFCQPAPINPTKLAEKVGNLGVLQYPTKFQTKILTGKLYL